MWLPGTLTALSLAWCAEARRTPQSYFGSVTPAQLAGGGYEVAEQPWAPERRAWREGAVIHVFVPDASLRLHGGLWVRAGSGGSIGLQQRESN